MEVTIPSLENHEPVNPAGSDIEIEMRRIGNGLEYAFVSGYPSVEFAPTCEAVIAHNICMIDGVWDVVRRKRFTPALNEQVVRLDLSSVWRVIPDGRVATEDLVQSVDSTFEWVARGIGAAYIRQFPVR